MDNRDKIKKELRSKHNPNEYKVEKPSQPVTPVWESTYETTPLPTVDGKKLAEDLRDKDYSKNLSLKEINKNPNAYGINKKMSTIKATWDGRSENINCPSCSNILTFDTVFLNYVCGKCGTFYDPKTLEKIKDGKNISISDERKANRVNVDVIEEEDDIKKPFKKVNRLSADSVKCPGCNSNMTYDLDFRGFICSNCGGIYNANDLTLITASHIYDEGELTDINDNQNEITCNNCGAHIITDKNTSATTCAFCGSPALIAGRLSRKFEPDYIIPFKINKDEAIKNLIEWAKTNKNIPKKFYSAKNVEKITGIYVPLWLTDADCKVDIDGDGLKVDGKESGAIYRINREYNMTCRMIPFDGSIKWNDALMTAIEPYDYKDMELYREAQAYLSGFMAERFDLPYYKMSDRIYRRIRNYAIQKALRTIKGYDRTRVTNIYPAIEKMEFYYCLAPIWFINYDYDGEKFQFIVNGQTGKVAGDAPISNMKQRIYYFTRYGLLKIAAVLAVLIYSAANISLLYLVFKLYSTKAGTDFYSLAFVLTMLIFACIFAADKVFSYLAEIYKEWHYKIGDHKFQEPITHLAPPAEQYVRFEFSETKENADDFYLSTDGDAFI